MRAARLTVAPPAAVTSSANALCSLAPPPPVARLGAPAGPRLRTPVCASRCARSQGLHRMIQVQPCMPLLGGYASRWPPERHALPSPRGPIRATEDGIRRGEREALHGGAPPGAPGLWPRERGVKAGGHAGLPLACSMDHRDAQHLRCTPRSGRAPAPCLGLGASCGLTPAPASAIPAAHHPTPRHGVLTHRARTLLPQPGPCRVARGHRPSRVGVPRHAPVGQDGLGLRQSAQHRGPQASLRGPCRGAALMPPSPHQAGLPTGGALAGASLPLATVRGPPPRHGMPLSRAPSPLDHAIVLARLGPRAHPPLWLGLPGRRSQSLLPSGSLR
jgi:hypothetical protein